MRPGRANPARSQGGEGQADEQKERMFEVVEEKQGGDQGAEKGPRCGVEGRRAGVRKGAGGEPCGPQLNCILR